MRAAQEVDLPRTLGGDHREGLLGVGQRLVVGLRPWQALWTVMGKLLGGAESVGVILYRHAQP